MRQKVTDGDKMTLKDYSTACYDNVTVLNGEVLSWPKDFEYICVL